MKATTSNAALTTAKRINTLRVDHRIGRSPGSRSLVWRVSSSCDYTHQVAAQVIEVDLVPQPRGQPVRLERGVHTVPG